MVMSFLEHALSACSWSSHDNTYDKAHSSSRSCTCSLYQTPRMRVPEKNTARSCISTILCLASVVDGFGYHAPLHVTRRATGFLHKQIGLRGGKRREATRPNRNTLSWLRKPCPARQGLQYNPNLSSPEKAGKVCLSVLGTTAISVPDRQYKQANRVGADHHSLANR